VDGQKKRRIITVMEAIERTPPSAKIMPIASAEATAEAEAYAEAETYAKAATAAETANLESTLSGIDKLLSDMAAEEAAAAALEKIMAAVLDKGKKIADAVSKEKDFDLRNLVDQELSEAEKKELHEYGISCGY
jgi:vacuolar-type H+-ATPase subunit I/STV1